MPMTIARRMLSPAPTSGRRKWSRRTSTSPRRAGSRRRSPSGWHIGTGCGRSAARQRAARPRENNFSSHAERASDAPMTQRGQRATRIALAAALFLLALYTVRAFLPALGWAVVIAIAAWPAYRRYLAGRHSDGRTAPALLATAAIAILVLIPF